MHKGRRGFALRVIGFLALSTAAFYFYDTASTNKNKTALFNSNSRHSLSRDKISQAISDRVLANQLPQTAAFDLEDGRGPVNFKLSYTLNGELQSYADQLLQSYRPDYAAIVLMNASTGEILSLSSFEKQKRYGTNLALKATYPAASIFKVITAATAVEKAGVDPETKIAFNGGNYTLYKKNVLSDRITKWTHFITLKEAFARSINTAFGRLSMEHIHPVDLQDYALRFGFNKDLPADFEVERSLATVPAEKGYELTEVASGYNRFNTLSPVHGALIASTIINEGKMPSPYLVKAVYNENNEVVYSADSSRELDIPHQIISAESAEKVKEMMEQTVLIGTSRKTFRQIIRDKKFREVEMGGKTGHFTGTDPKGRTDWFVGYASDGEDRIAIAAITVNVEKWTVKSSALGQMMFRKYFNEKNEQRLGTQQESRGPASVKERRIADSRN